MVAESTFDPTQLANFGTLGIVLVAALFGWIWVKPAVDKLLEERDRLIGERDRALEQREVMATVLQDKLLPIVQDFRATVTTLIPILQQVQQLQQMIPILNELLRRLGEYPPTQAPPADRPDKQRRRRQ